MPQELLQKRIIKIRRAHTHRRRAFGGAARARVGERWRLREWWGRRERHATHLPRGAQCSPRQRSKRVAVCLCRNDLFAAIFAPVVALSTPRTCSLNRQPPSNGRKSRVSISRPRRRCPRPRDPRIHFQPYQSHTTLRRSIIEIDDQRGAVTQSARSSAFLKFGSSRTLIVSLLPPPLLPCHRRRSLLLESRR